MQMRKSAVQRVQKYGGKVEAGSLTHAENTRVSRQRTSRLGDMDRLNIRDAVGTWYYYTAKKVMGSH